MSVTLFLLNPEGSSIHHSQMGNANRSNCCCRWWEEINQNNFHSWNTFSGDEINYFLRSPHLGIPFTFSSLELRRKFYELSKKLSHKEIPQTSQQKAIPPKQLFVGMHDASLSTENILWWIIFDIEKSTRNRCGILITFGSVFTALCC